jgi:plasmid stabilization system protein ParE
MIGYTPEAARDLVRHQTHLSQFSDKSAQAFLSRLTLAEARTARRPKTYRVLHDRETRRYSFRINRTTYLIDYRIDAAHIVVLRVWHGRQDRPE